jgi:cell fate regulator YaaT (PSP1 superfamily)
MKAPPSGSAERAWGQRLVRIVYARVGENARIVLEVPRGTYAPGTVVTWRSGGAQGTARTLGLPALAFDPPRVHGVVAGIANESDINRDAKLRAREATVADIGRKIVREMDLPAKVVRAEAADGGAKFTLLLCAEDRIDFRTVLRAIGQRTRERVELSVIGDRDAAKLVGGVGPCGLQLCCNTFLQNFEPVGMRMAREQGLALHPERVNGVCGRLLCCLVYEDAAYRAARAAVPKLGDVRTIDGEAFTVTGVDALEGRVQLRSSQGVVRTMPVEVLPAVAQRPEGSEAPEPSAKSPR